jgi:hypothetical protein
MNLFMFRVLRVPLVTLAALVLRVLRTPKRKTLGTVLLVLTAR